MITEFKIKEIPVGMMDVLYNIPKESERLENYFKIEQRASDKDFNLLLSKLDDHITLIKYIEIYAKFRGKKLGNKLLDQIIKNSNSDLLLVAETKDSFLVDWYQKKGFEIVGYNYKLPILLLKK